MIRELAARLGDVFAERFDKKPISSVPALGRFVGTRAAYVAQTALHGYLKTRMGTSFRRHFEDEAFSRVIRDSSVKLFVSCLSDLTVFAVATGRTAGSVSDDEAVEIAKRCYRDGLAHAMEKIGFDALPPGVEEEFAARLDGLDWSAMAAGESAFAGSVADLIRFAPVVDEFKDLDREIVRNSIRFRWRDVRESCRKRLDGAAVFDDWRRTGGATATPA